MVCFDKQVKTNRKTQHTQHFASRVEKSNFLKLPNAYARTGDARRVEVENGGFPPVNAVLLRLNTKVRRSKTKVNIKIT